MSSPMLGLSPKAAAGLTGWYLLFQIGLLGLVGIVVGLVGAITGRPSPVANGVDPLVLILVNSAAAFLVLRLQLRKSRLS